MRCSGRSPFRVLATIAPSRNTDYKVVGNQEGENATMNRFSFKLLRFSIRDTCDLCGPFSRHER
jgi:hypothetical protein